MSTVRQDTDSGLATRDKRADRFSARSVLWRESNLKRVRACGRAGRGDGSQIVVRATGAGDTRHAGYGNLQHCGSVWACPVCSATIAAARHVELSAFLRAWHFVPASTVKDRCERWQHTARSVGHITLTMRHHDGQQLATLWGALAGAWNAATSRSRDWAVDRAEFQIAGTLRVVEDTIGENGWHLHIHALIFSDKDLSSVAYDELGQRMFARWSSALVAAGLDAPALRAGGMHASKLTANEAIGEFAKYFSKATYEVIGGDKRGGADGRGGRTPFQILADVVDPETGEIAGNFEEDLALWHEYERASKGKMQMVYSRGFRRALAEIAAMPATETTDQDLVDEDLGGAVLAVITSAGWKTILGTPWLYYGVLRAAQADDDGVILRQELEAWGIGWQQPPEPDATKLPNG